VNTTYVCFEIMRLFRNRRFFIFSLVIPLVLYLVIGVANKNQTIDFGTYKINFRTYYMVSMAAYGAMIGALSGGARITTERMSGWNRQLRLTPLSVRTYFGVKLLTGLLLSLVSILLLYVAGIATGVSLDGVGPWFGMTGLMIVGLLPFLALGTLLGHLLTADSIGPAVGGIAALFGFLGGQWAPLPNDGFLHDLAVCVPSFWMTQASHVGIGGGGWAVRGWLVVAVWTAVAALLAAKAYQRDTARV